MIGSDPEIEADGDAGLAFVVGAEGDFQAFGAWNGGAFDGDVVGHWLLLLGNEKAPPRGSAVGSDVVLQLVVAEAVDSDVEADAVAFNGSGFLVFAGNAQLEAN